MSWKFDPYTGEPINDGDSVGQDAKAYLGQNLKTDSMRSDTSVWIIVTITVVIAIVVSATAFICSNTSKIASENATSKHQAHHVHKDRDHSSVVPEDGKSPYIGDRDGYVVVPNSDSGSDGDWKTPDEPSGSQGDVKDPRADGIHHL